MELQCPNQITIESFLHGRKKKAGARQKKKTLVSRNVRLIFACQCFRGGMEASSGYLPSLLPVLVGLLWGAPKDPPRASRRSR